MADIDANQEKFRQQDVFISHEAGDSLRMAIDDPNSFISSDIFKDQDRLAAYLEAAEREIRRKRLDGQLAELGVFGREGGMEAEVISLALKMRRELPDAPKGVVVLYADINGLREVNNTLGHPAGDKLIFKVVERLRKVLRNTDDIGRVGGDEMVALLPFSNRETADRILNIGSFEHDGSARPGILPALTEELEQLLAEFKDEYKDKWPAGDENKRPGMASVGWHFFTREEFLQRFQEFLDSKDKGKQFITMLVKEADEAMYQSKRGLSPDASPEKSES